MRGLFSHAIEVGNFLQFQGVEIGEIFYKTFIDKLVNNFVTQAVNVHGVASGVVQKRLLALGRARCVDAAVGHFPFHSMDGAAAFRALLRHAKLFALISLLSPLSKREE